MTSGPLALLCPPLREQSQSNGARALSGLDSDAQSAGSSSEPAARRRNPLLLDGWLWRLVAPVDPTVGA
jgi:hypothetical protein